MALSNVQAIAPERATITNLSTGAPSRDLEVDAMCWAADKFGFYIAHKNGIVRSYISADQAGAALPALSVEARRSLASYCK